MKQWYTENPKLFNEVKTSLAARFPTLHVVIENAVVFIRGALHLPEGIDYYSIEVELLADYPKSVPLVREIGGRITRNGDRHIWTNGTCCLFVAEDTWKYYPKGTTIVDFIEKVVTAHFINQTHFELTGKWLWGERSHGLDGILEFYKEELKTDDLVLIYKFIEHLAKVNVKKYWLCYCGSKKKFQHCHFRQLLDYRQKIKPEIAKNSLLLFNYEIEKYRQSKKQKRH